MANLSEARGWRDSIVVLLVSVYLVGVGTFLILTRRIVAPSFLHVFCALMRRPYSGIVSEMHPEHGYCFYTRLPSRLLSDLENVSSLLLFEDGRPLGPPHAPHDQLRALGGGRFSHWGAHLYFSTSDNSDPRFNGRRYTVKETPRSTSVFSRREGGSPDLGA